MNDKHHHCNCDSNHGLVFEISDLLNAALASGYRGYPPLYTTAGHPGCLCSLIFNKGQNFTSYMDIPDSCPSVPVTDNVELKNKRKQEIYRAIPEVLYINSATHPPLFITDKKAAWNLADIRYADDSTIPMNRPVRINKNSIAVGAFGFWQAIPEGALGFILKAEGAYAEIFYINYLCKVKIKRENISIIDSLHEAATHDLNKDVFFIMSDGKLAAPCYIKNGKVHAYFPDQDRIREITDYSVLEV